MPSSLTPVAIDGLDHQTHKFVSAQCVITTLNQVRCWNADGTFTLPGLEVDVNEFAFGFSYKCGVTTEGAVVCSESNKDTYATIPQLSSGITDIAATFRHQCVLSDAGAVKCWGLNLAGALGNGTFDSQSLPTTVIGLEADVDAVEVGSIFTCGLMHSGSVKCAGVIGSHTSLTATQVTGLASGVRSISGAGEALCAILDGGAAKCIGDDTARQVDGDGGITNSAFAVSTSGLHACVLTTDKGVRCWGGNSSGQLGDGTLSSRTTATPGIRIDCGDGTTDLDEECDDGNTSDNDTCTTSCSLAACGDGFIEIGVEDCDDGNTSDEDDCLSSCTTAVCGDGIVADSNEECDDGNADDSDSCRSSCKLSICGDGVTQTGVEDCDDANFLNNDGCLNTCEHPHCGDGFLWPVHEVCDDGNLFEDDECLSNCLAPTCGDLNSTGTITAGDALMVLKSAVGQNVPLQCKITFHMCGDFNGSGTSTAADALLVLKAAVGQPANLVCLLAQCGDAVKGGPEDCDAALPEGTSCTSQGFLGGTLSCGSNCQFDTSECYATRFEYGKDASVVDNTTGLQWKNTAAEGSSQYAWTSTGTAPDGPLFTAYLQGANSSWHAGFSDWRIPTLAELSTIVNPATGSCYSPPFGCQKTIYWTATESSENPQVAYAVHFANGWLMGFSKLQTAYARAVRTVTSQLACGTVNESQTLVLGCDTGTLSTIEFASYGTPTGTCGSFAKGFCHAASSMGVVANLCLGKSSCSIDAHESQFGDPCFGVTKRLSVQARCS